jgi:hypothetical protein
MQVNCGEYNSPLMTNVQFTISDLEQKLENLRGQLARLEGEEAEKIRIKRIEADMGDDFRENEGAKLVMDDHNLWFLRKLRLMDEIRKLKVEIIKKKNLKK